MWYMKASLYFGLIVALLLVFCVGPSINNRASNAHDGAHGEAAAGPVRACAYHSLKSYSQSSGHFACAYMVYLCVSPPDVSLTFSLCYCCGQRNANAAATVVTTQHRHQSVLDYLSGMGERFADTAAAFEREAGITKSTDGTCMLVVRSCCCVEAWLICPQGAD